MDVQLQFVVRVQLFQAGRGEHRVRIIDLMKVVQLMTQSRSPATALGPLALKPQPCLPQQVR
jgi:hypothetical protein